MERLRLDHRDALLEFERDNRAYFTTSISDRGDDYFAHFDEGLRALLDEQATGVCHFHVLVDENGEIVGRVNLFDVADGAAALGFRIAEKAAGKGLATAAVRELCTLAVKDYGLTRLLAAAADDNIGSRTVLARAGFVPTGEEVTLGGRSGHRYLLHMNSPQRSQPADLDVVRESYDRVADNYVDMVLTTGLGDVRTHPWHRAALDVFADAVGTLGPVLDVGCGPGTVTAYLAERGLDVSGVDLSPRMIEHARRLHPECAFSVGSSTELDLAEASWGGLLGWFSLFNLPRHILPEVLASFARALVPHGQLIIATHVGDDDAPRSQAYGGVPVTWTTYRWQPGQLAALLDQAGLRLTAELRIPPEGPIGPTVILVAQRDG